MRGLSGMATRLARKPRRVGAAMVELALFLPVFFMITMATVETCRVLYLRQSLTIAAYECARLGIVPGMSLDALQSQCDAIMNGRNIKGAVLSTNPASLESLRYGDTLTVSISVALDTNVVLSTWFYRGRRVTETTTIMAEY